MNRLMTGLLIAAFSLLSAGNAAAADEPNHAAGGDVEALANQFAQGFGRAAAAHALITTKGKEGLTALVRALPQLPDHERLAWVKALAHGGPEAESTWLQANFLQEGNAEVQAWYAYWLAGDNSASGQQWFKSLVEQHPDVRVRIAAASAMVKSRSAEDFDRFYAQMAQASIDYESGRNDTWFARLDPKQEAYLSAHVKTRLQDKSAGRGEVLTAIALARSGDAEMYSWVIENDQLEAWMVSFMIDHAIRVGAPDLLVAIARNPRTSAYKALAENALLTAKRVMAWRELSPEAQVGTRGGFTLPVVSAALSSTSDAPALPGAYAVVYVDKEGLTKVLTYDRPFGQGQDNLLDALDGRRIMPATHNYREAEAVLVISAP